MHDKFLQISSDEYHADKSAVGHSALVRMLRSPAHFAEYMNEVYEPTPAMQFGTAMHAAFLEPWVFETTYDVVKEEVFIGTLQSLDDYKAAADKLGIAYGVPGKEELKAAIKAADANSEFRFKDDVAAAMANYSLGAFENTLQSMDDYKAAALALGIDAKLKKDELKAAIKAADTTSQYRFKEDVQAHIAALTQEKLAGTLQSLDDYKAAAISLGVRVEALTKEELKAAIKAADANSEFRFRDDVFAEIYGDKIILTDEQMQAIVKMRNKALSHKGARKFLQKGKSELTAYWTDPVTGIKCKCRLDFLMDNGETLTGILDVKSTLDASITGFARAIGKYGYDLQAAYYTDAVKELTGLTLPFYFLASEKNGPHEAAVYKASDAMIETGRKKYRAALELLQWCREQGEYPGYQPFGDVEEINLARWDDFDDE